MTQQLVKPEYKHWICFLDLLHLRKWQVVEAASRNWGVGVLENIEYIEWFGSLFSLDLPATWFSGTSIAPTLSRVPTIQPGPILARRIEESSDAPPRPVAFNMAACFPKVPVLARRPFNDRLLPKSPPLP